MSDIQPSSQVTQALLFNYSHIDEATTNYLKQNADETRGLMKRTTEDMSRIGHNLLEAKRRLPHGQFLPWVKAELDISQSTAWRFMQIAQGKEIKKSFTVNDMMAICAPDDGTEEEFNTVEAAAALPYPDTVEFLQKKLDVATTLEELQALQDKALKMKNSYASHKTSDTDEKIDEEEGDWDDFIKETTPKMKARGTAIAQEAIEIGKMLLDTVSGEFNVGRMKEWAAAEFGMDDQDVYEFVKCGNRYKNTPIDELPESTMWQIVGTYSSWYLDRYKKRPVEPPFYAEKKLLASVQAIPEFHEMTRVIPAMKPREYADLVESIKQNGLILPIKTFRGKIIDGRMRYLACRDAGVLPRFEELKVEELTKEETDVTNSDILRYICSVNAIRTSLTEDQQAMIEFLSAGIPQ